VFFGTAGAPAAIIAAGMALSFFNLGAWGALYAVTPEMYPTSLRATGSGWAAGVGRIASIVAPLTVPPLLLAGGAPALFVVFAAFFAVAAVAAWGLVDRRGAALDDR
jgi:putative MFS transporter